MEAEPSFGAWVRRRRRALDLLQKELANRVGCSITALQKIERDERRPSRHLAERLAESLDLPSDQRATFLQVARGERMTERLASMPEAIAPPAQAQPALEPARREPAAPATTLIGREAELANIAQLLHDPQCRLLTLTGPGGIGKTRLALAAQQETFAQDIVFVALAPLLGREQVVTAIADALGCVLYGTRDRAEQLAQYLSDKAVLLVLDNFEHLLADAACADLISQLLRGTEKLKLLITSREPLDIHEEWVFDVQGLPTPLSATAPEVEASSAARLFQQRGRQARAGYTLSADDHPAVVRICQLVGGVPLGIELAATWMRTLSCQEIADEIQRNLDFLATRARDVPERHRSIRAVFDQSWALLAAEEQRVLRRVAVFRGGFTRAAAEDVAGASLALLAALVAKSLLRRTSTGRYDPHELVRQYALDQLREDAQEEAETRVRHCRYYARLLEQRGVAFKGPGQVGVVAELSAELANIRLAWEWACAHQLAAEVSQAADTLFWLYEAQSNFREGIPLFGQAAESLQQPSMGTSLAAGRERELALGQALSYQGFFCFRQGQHPWSRELLQRSIALLGGLADDGAHPTRAALSTAAAFLGIVTYRMGDYAEGRRLLGEGLAIKRALGDQWGAALCLRQLGLAAYSQGDYAEAHQLLSESVVLSRAMGNPWSLAFSLNFLSRVAYAQGAYDEAQLLLQEGLALSRDLTDRFNIASAQNGLGMVHRARGQASEARRSFEESIATWRKIGDQDSLAQCLNQLGETLLGSGDRSAARDCFVEALVVAREAQVAPVMLDALLGVATLCAEEGATETPLELALHILENPASTQDARGRADRLRAALERHLPPQQIETIRSRGRERTLTDLAAPDHIAALLAVSAAGTDRGRASEVSMEVHAGPVAQTAAPIGPLDSTPSQPVSRLPTGTVTFCFTDIEGSTQLWDQHPDEMRTALARHDTIVQRAIQSQGGVVFKSLGDSIYAVFTSARDALDAALAMQRAIRDEPWEETGPLRVRIALHSGVAQERDGDYYGAVLNRVARILALGHGAQILLSHAAYDLVVDDLPPQTSLRDLGEFQLKDLSRPERLFQFVAPGLPANFPPLRTSEVQSAPRRDAAPLLATKQHIPAQRSQIVPRPRLLDRMQAGLQGKLTLIVAPAGYGKTTLIAQGVEAWNWSLGQDPLASSLQPPAPRTAWVSLDEADSDPLRFWSYVIAALDTFRPGSGALALDLLRSPQPPAIETTLTPLLNALHMLATDVVLVLDDYHLIGDPSIHTALAFLLDHLPPRMHLIIITRADPPLPLTRLRARGQLTELRAADLRFTPEESAIFLTGLMELPLSADDIAALDARTEGWIAGLQLAALAMRDRADLPNFVAAFTGSHRFLVDYLAEEVFASQPYHIQMFLLQTAILDRMCGPLCDAILVGERHEAIGNKGEEVTLSPSAYRLAPDAAYSQLILAQLERANLFVVSLDDERNWYRYHHLFAEVLRARLHNGAAPNEVAALHQRASAWYERSSLPPEAIKHALVGQDWERAARLIEQCTWPVAYQGQIHTVLGWFSALPTAFMQTQPQLCVLHALLLIHTNQLEAAEARLQEAEWALRPDMPEELTRSVQGRILTTRANIYFYRGDLPDSVDLGLKALDMLPSPYDLSRVAASTFAAQAFLITGDATPATEREVAAVAPAAQAASNRFVELRGFTLLAELQTLQGRIQAAATTYRKAAQLGPEPAGLRSMVGSAAYYFGLGDIYREWNDLAAADRLLAEGMDFAMTRVTANAVYLERGFRALARLRQAQGDHAGAMVALATFTDLGRRRGFDPLILARAAALQAQLSLAQNDLGAAARWAEASGLHADDVVSFAHELEYLTLVHLLIANARNGAAAPNLDDALSLLDRLLAAAEAGARVSGVIEILVLRALALEARADIPGALAALDRAITLAAPQGYVRVFVDEGQPMAELLAEAQQHGMAPAYVEKLLNAFPERLEARDLRLGDAAQASNLKPLASQLVEPLTDREIEILRLIAEGHSNQAIADILIIAVSTVKRHINNIYGKLDVQSRTQALARARELRIL